MSDTIKKCEEHNAPPYGTDLVKIFNRLVIVGFRCTNCGHVYVVRLCDGELFPRDPSPKDVYYD